MSHEQHKDKAADAIGCVVVTASDTRDESTDGSGKLIQELRNSSIRSPESIAG